MITNKKKDYLYKFFQKNLKLLWKITAKLIYIFGVFGEAVDGEGDGFPQPPAMTGAW